MTRDLVVEYAMSRLGAGVRGFYYTWEDKYATTMDFDNSHILSYRLLCTLTHLLVLRYRDLHCIHVDCLRLQFTPFPAPPTWAFLPTVTRASNRNIECR